MRKKWGALRKDKSATKASHVKWSDEAVRELTHFLMAYGKDHDVPWFYVLNTSMREKVHVEGRRVLVGWMRKHLKQEHIGNGVMKIWGSGERRRLVANLVPISHPSMALVLQTTHTMITRILGRNRIPTIDEADTEDRKTWTRVSSLLPAHRGTLTEEQRRDLELLDGVERFTEEQREMVNNLWDMVFDNVE